MYRASVAAVLAAMTLLLAACQSAGTSQATEEALRNLEGGRYNSSKGP